MEVFGQFRQDAMPLLHLSSQVFGLEPGAFGQDAGAIFVALDTHALAAANVGEGDSSEMRRVGDDGIERQLRFVGPLAKPLGRLGLAGLVIEDDFAGRFSVDECGIDAVYAYVEMEWADPNVAQGFFARLHAEG